jgi:hypothetical protein
VRKPATARRQSVCEGAHRCHCSLGRRCCAGIVGLDNGHLRCVHRAQMRGPKHARCCHAALARGVSRQPLRVLRIDACTCLLRLYRHVSAVACMGRTESKAALRTFGSAAGPHAGTQRIRNNVHASGCSGGRGTCFLPDPTAPPLQLVQSWTSPCRAHLVPPDAFQGAPAKSESVIQHTQLTRQPRSAAVSGTLASLRVTLTLVDRRRACRGDEYAHISTSPP